MKRKRAKMITVDCRTLKKIKDSLPQNYASSLTEKI